MKRETPVVLVLWEEVVNDLLECTSHFPRTLRRNPHFPSEKIGVNLRNLRRNPHFAEACAICG